MLKREFVRKGEQTKAVPREGLYLKVYGIQFHVFLSWSHFPKYASVNILYQFFGYRLKSMYEDDDKLFQLFFGIFFHK